MHKNNCLSGDIEIHFAIPNQVALGKYGSTKKYTISHLYNSWIPSNDTTYNIKNRIEKMWIKSFDIENNILIYANILDILNFGPQKIYKISLENGKAIKSTKDQNFLTKDGFLTLEHLLELEFFEDNVEMTKIGTIANGEVPIYDNLYTVGYNDIISVKYIGEQETYSILTDKNNYIANGVVVGHYENY